MKENTYVRTAAELERKYNFVSMKKAVEQTETGLTKTNGQLEQFVSNLDNIQDQIDGKLETWYGNGEPTLENYPANTWSNYEEHISDIYYDQDTGNSYRFTGSEWEECGDTSLSQALSLANAAQDTADGKRRVFAVTPTPPYDVGDLWLNNQELYICQIEKASDETFQDGDFIKATDYATNSALLTLDQAVGYIDTRVGTIQTDLGTLTMNFETTRTATDENSTTLDKWSKQITVDGDITLSATNSDYSLKIENDGIHIYNNGKDISNWQKDNFTVTQLNLGNFAFIPRENGSLGFRKVK